VPRGNLNSAKQYHPGLTSPGGKTRKWNRSIDRRCERLITIAVSASIYNALMWHIRRVSSVTANFHRRKPRVTIRRDFLRNSHGFAEVVANSLRVCISVAMPFLKRQTVEVRRIVTRGFLL
jgi:hypothetical protein